jgi:hypothetical protein
MAFFSSFVNQIEKQAREVLQEGEKMLSDRPDTEGGEEDSILSETTREVNNPSQVEEEEEAPSQDGGVATSPPASSEVGVFVKPFLNDIYLCAIYYESVRPHAYDG